MIHWLIGRSGTGKTTRLLEELPALAAQYERVYVLTPEQGSMALERRIGGTVPDNRIRVVSFRRLCNEIFRALGGIAGVPMTRAREAALIFKVLLDNRASLRYYRNAHAGVGFVEKLRETFSELTLSGLTREQVLPLLENRQDWKEKYQDLFLLYDAYLAAQNAECRDPAGDLARATALAAEKRFFEKTAVVIDGFFGFTGTQREMLRTVFRDSPCVWCSFTADPAGGEPVLAPIENEWRILRGIAKELGTETGTETLSGESKRLKTEQLRWMERQFFADRPGGAMPAGNSVFLHVGRNIREELTLAALTISRAVREENLRYRDFALVAGSLEDYGPVAEQVFRKYGIPLFVDQGRASLSKPLFLFVQGAVRIVSRNFRAEDVLAFLKTGLCGETPDRIAALENYCIRWKPAGKSWSGEEPWTANPDGLAPRTPENEARLAELNQLRERIRLPLLRFAGAMNEGTGKALAEGIFRLTEDFGVPEQIAAAAKRYQELSRHAGSNAQSDLRFAREYAALYGTLADILDDIYLVFGDSRVETADLADLIDLCGEEATLNLVPPTVDAVSMGAVSHSRLGEVRRIFAVGANQDLLPPAVRESGLIGDRERQIFAENRLPCNATLEQNIRQEEARLYSVLFSATEEIRFFYSAFSVTGAPLNPSPYVRRLEQYGVRAQSAEALYGGSGTLDLYDFAATKDGARELMSRVPAWRAPILAELCESPRAKQRPDDRLTAELVQKFFRNRLQLSYSSISDFYKCPFMFFIARTLKIRPVEEVRFDPLNIGNFVHAGMEKIVPEMCAGQGPAAWDPEKIRQFCADFSAEYLRDKLRDIRQTPRFLALYGRMSGLLNTVAQSTAAELASGAFRPLGSEVPIRVALPLRNGKEAVLTGSVDRVDTMTDENGTWIKVTDYKTGGKTFEFTGVTNRTEIQLPVYLYGIAQSGAVSHPLPAAACYFNAITPEFKVRIKPEELPEKMRLNYRRDGLFCNDPAVLRALDESVGAAYFKIDYKKDGSLGAHTHAYPRALLEELTAHMETVITETAEAIYGGETAFSPLKGEGHNACAYCKYHAVCRHGEADPAREYEKDPEGWRKGAAE